MSKAAARRQPQAKNTQPSAESGKAAPGAKAALVRAVAHNLESFSMRELRSFKQLVETKRSHGKRGGVITAYIPDAAVGTTVTFTLDDGSSVVGRTNVSHSGQLVVVEPKRRVVTVRAKGPLERTRERHIVLPPYVLDKSKRHVATAHAKGPLNRAREQYRSLREAIVEQSLSLTKAARRMNLTTQGLSARVSRGEMLAFVEHNRKMVPIELIDDEQPDRTVRGLSAVMEAAKIEPFRLAVWLLHPAYSLGERRPVDELRAGNVERVVAAVRSIDAS